MNLSAGVRYAGLGGFVAMYPQNASTWYTFKMQGLAYHVVVNCVQLAMSAQL